MVAEFKVVRAFVSAGPLIGGREAAARPYQSDSGVLCFPILDRRQGGESPQETHGSQCRHKDPRKQKEAQVLVQHDGTPKVL